MLCPHEQAPAAYGRKLRGQAMDRLAKDRAKGTPHGRRGATQSDAPKISAPLHKRPALVTCSIQQIIDRIVFN